MGCGRTPSRPRSCRRSMRSATRTRSRDARRRCGRVPRSRRWRHSRPASAPATHRLIEPGLGFLPRLGRTRPVAWELARASVPADIVTAALGPAALPVAWALASTAGVRRLVAKGSRARKTAAAAQRLLSQPEERLLFVYLPDCDRAGHAHGWMSAPYLEAAAEVDAAIGQLSQWTDDAVFIVTADHGGGGVTVNEHDEPHPVNDHIPLVVAGPGVTRRHQLTRAISLLDIPATVLWWFGVAVPDGYEGRPLLDAFVPAPAPTLAAPAPRAASVPA